MIIAIDPGKTTGYAQYDEVNKRLIIATQYSAWTELLEKVEAVCAKHRDVVIACETYTITPQTIKKSRQYHALYIIGALNWLAHRHRQHLVLQPPAEAKGFVTNDKLEAIGWKQPTKYDHANDALRHLVLYLVKARLIEPQVLLGEDG